MMKANHLIAEIDLAAMVHNCRVLRGLTKPPCRLCVAVKGNAYGHGIGIVLPALQAAKVDMLAVVTIGEAGELRQLGWSGPVLLMGSELSVYDGGEKAERAAWLVEHEISVTVSAMADLDALAAAGDQLGRRAIVHVMLDSGMTREGVYESQARALIDRGRESDCVTVEGVYTHLAAADDDDKAFTNSQLARFRDFVDGLRAAGVVVPIVHAANSPATIDLPESHFDMVRPGISVYGIHSSSQMHHRPDLKQVMRVKSSLTLVKRVPKASYVGYGCTFHAPSDMTIGIVPIGYADGYDRRLSNAGKMTIADRVVSVIGRVSMDQTIVDLSPLVRDGLQAAPGQEVIVVDSRPGSPNTVEALYTMLDTVPQEIVSRLGNRAVRVAVNQERLA